MKNKIIALIDTRTATNNISSYIIQLAKSIEANVTFCDIIAVNQLRAYSVQQPAVGMTNAAAVAPIYKAKVEELVKDAEQVLQFTCDKYATEWEFIDYEIIRSTNYIDDLKELIKAKQANLLVLGRDESPNFLEKWLGNKATMIADATNIPTLIIPRNHSFHSFQNILHHIELKGRDMTKLKHTVQFAKQFDASITAAFFDTEEQYILYKKRIHLLNKIARYPKLEFKYYAIDNIKASMNTLIQEKDIDLIAMNYQDENIMSRLFNNNYSDNLILSLDTPFFIY